jgi:nitrite reductase/ring-hydroxylating ferredoxin subunit/uncharacterized membrane protein
MSTPTAPSPLHALTASVESLEALDAVAKPIAKNVRSTIGPGTLKDALSGTWLGHALHPLLTDVVIGAWTSASMLDLMGGRGTEDAARKLVGVGLAAYGPTALTGMTDWSDSEIGEDAIRRVGIVHAATNGTAAALYALSYRARRKGNRGAGTALGLAGAALISAGGYLGAHMSYQQGVGVDQTTFDQGPSEWTAVDAEAPAEGQTTSALVGDTPLVLVRDGGTLRALHDRCSHRGCPLSDVGTVKDGVIECGCHGSRFSLSDGAVQRGPATADQPAFEVREQGGRLEVRLVSA